MPSLWFFQFYIAYFLIKITKIYISELLSYPLHSKVKGLNFFFNYFVKKITNFIRVLLFRWYFKLNDSWESFNFIVYIHNERVNTKAEWSGATTSAIGGNRQNELAVWRQCPRGMVQCHFGKLYRIWFIYIFI